MKIKHLRFLYSITFFLYLGILQSNSQVVKRVDPPFWWTEMKNPELQIMVYGDKIAEYNIRIEQEEFLKSVDKIANANYIFLNLAIPENIQSTTLKINFEKDGKVIESIDYELKERSKSKNQHQGFNNSDVIYLLMPDRFSNGNPDNDNSEDMLEKADRKNPNARHGGDIQGIINHLDYFNELGVTTLWINPLMENNQEAYTYHGYAISDHYRIDPRYGSNLEYADLVNEAHKKGIKIVKDIVLNHCGINHWWMTDLPSEDWVHQFEEFTRSNFRSPVITDPYASKYDFYLQQNGWFDTNMPDLNQNNKFLLTYLIQNTIWWIEFSGLDGVRLDTQPYSDKDMIATWAKMVNAEYPNFTILGEAWLQKIPITAYWQESSNNFDGYSSNIPIVTDFPLHYAITQAFNEEQSWSEGMAKLYYVLAQDFVYENPMNTLIFLDNHDVSRIYSSLNKDINKLKMAIAFQLTTRGIPSVYYGSEILMEGFEHESHGKMRMDFPGGWPNDETNAFTKEGRTDSQNELFYYYSNILNWRKSKTAIHSGRLTHFIPENNIYVYFRQNEDNCVMVILNNNNSNQTINTEKFTEIITNYNTGIEIISGSEITNLKQININKKSAMIIELKN
ncbi:glycoside hydrolase family 13 protein [Bacteroidota bacterium]